MLSLKAKSYAFTAEYLNLIFASVRLAEKGADASIHDINVLNQTRMTLNIVSEELCYILMNEVLNDDDY